MYKLRDIFLFRVMHISEIAFRYVFLLFMVITVHSTRYKASSQSNGTSPHAINYDVRPQRPCSTVLAVHWWRSEEVKLPIGAKCVLSIHAAGVGVDTALALRLSGSQMRVFAPHHGYLWDIARCCDPGKPSAMMMSGSRWLLVTATDGSLSFEAFTYVSRTNRDVQPSPRSTDNAAAAPKYSDL